MVMKSGGRRYPLASKDRFVSDGDVMSRVFVVERRRLAPVVGGEIAPSQLFDDDLAFPRTTGDKNRAIALNGIAGNDLDHR